MKIINPLYDKAFKYLMENNKLAKKILSVILDVEVIEVALSQQETTLPDERKSLTLFRLDFKAIIKQADGSQKTVLIELQKSKYLTDIQRFRSYLGANYLAKKQETDEKAVVAEEKPAEYKSIYPIIAIYILGYNLDDLPYMAVTVNRDVINSVNKQKIEVSSFFVEHLTHQSHIIQVRRLPEKRQTLLEKFFVLFNQAWCTDNNFILDLQNIPEEFKDVVKYLQGPVMDDDFRRQLEAEEQLDTIFDAQEAKYLRKIAEALDQKAAAEERALEERRQKEEANKQKEEANKQKEVLAIKLARQMKNYGASNDAIAKETGLSIEDIENL
jgi:hypothetical protein